MKYLLALFLTSLTLLSCSPELAIEKQDLVGAWRTTSDSRIDEDMSIKEDSVEIYYADGSFESQETAWVYWNEDEQIFAMIKGVDKGKWSIEGGNIKIKYSSLDITHFSSDHPFFTRESLEAEIPDTIREPQWLIPVSINGDVLVIRAVEDETLYTMRRIHDD